MFENITYTKQDWIDLVLVPFLGGFEEDYDLEAIADEALDYDESKGGLVDTTDEETLTSIIISNEKI